MTDEEKECLRFLAEAWNRFCKLPNHHPMAQSEFASKIHELQYMIAARVAKRVNPEIWMWPQ